MKDVGAYTIYAASQQERPDSWQEYYVRLRGALHDELMNTGRSELIVELQTLEKGDSIQYLAAAVVYDCYYMLVLGRPQTDVTVYFPSWQGERQPWSVLERRAEEYRVRVQGALQERLEALAAVAAQMYDLRMETIAPSEEAAADAAASREAERMRSEIARLRRELDALRTQNQTLSRDLMDLENGYISDTVHMHMAQRRQEAEIAFEAEMAERRKEAEDAFRRHYEGEAESLLRHRDEADRQAAAAMETYRSGSRAVRSSISESIEGMKRAMEKQLDEWETALRSVDYRFLAQCYVSLSSVVRVEMAQTLAEAAAQGTPDAVMQSLQVLQTSFAGQLLRMENMMTQLGLTVLRPEVGDAYDEQRHLRSGVLTYVLPVRPVVERMVVPGVMQGSDVLVRAEVCVGSGTEEA